VEVIKHKSKQWVMGNAVMIVKQVRRAECPLVAIMGTSAGGCDTISGINQ